MALTRPFFARPSPVVARAMLGCWLARRVDDGVIRVQISETEAYLGFKDPASHAYRGETARNRPMFGGAGRAYVYFIYGMHFCFNVVTAEEGVPEAVLIRGALAAAPDGYRLDGPARLCRALSIGREHNLLDLCSSPPSAIWLEAGTPAEKYRVAQGPRVGVRDLSALRFRLVPREPVGI